MGRNLSVSRLLVSLLFSDSSQKQSRNCQIHRGDVARNLALAGRFADFKPGATVAIDMNSHTGPLA